MDSLEPAAGTNYCRLNYRHNLCVRGNDDKSPALFISLVGSFQNSQIKSTERADKFHAQPIDITTTRERVGVRDAE